MIFTTKLLLSISIIVSISIFISKRSKVWSEASMVDAGAFEFSGTEDFLVVSAYVLS